jgi:ring-1,2-phenylacetyl-CoA epoxidase subunit PaaC
MAMSSEAVVARRERLLQLADSNLILAQQLTAWCGHAPMIEEDLAQANVALDLLGQARQWYRLVCASEPEFGDEDRLAMLRDVAQWRNLLLCEIANGDFAQTLVRQALYDEFHVVLLTALVASSDAGIAEIAAKAVKEARYHRLRSADLLVRLGDGTSESHARCQRALDRLWPHVAELFVDHEGDALLAAMGVAPLPSSLEETWGQAVGTLARKATLTLGAVASARAGGRQKRHTEHLGFLLAEMQFMQRSYPEATW